MPPARIKRPNHSTLNGMYLANPVAGAIGGVTAATMGAAPGSLLVMELGKLGKLGRPGILGKLDRPGNLGKLGNPGKFGKDNPGKFGKDNPGKDNPPT